MHDSSHIAVHLKPRPEAPVTNRSPTPLQPAMKGALVALLAVFGLCGCVGVWMETPYKQVSKTAAHQELIGNGLTPVISHTQQSTSERQWCGTTLWAVVLPIPLKLPVCESYSATAYGNNIHGVETPLLYTSKKVSSDFYACGPFMFLGPLMHTYQGNAVCGIFR